MDQTEPLEGEVGDTNIYTLAEASNMLGITAEGVRLRVKRGLLEGVRVNEIPTQRVRITSADLARTRLKSQQPRQQSSKIIGSNANSNTTETNSSNSLEEAVGLLNELLAMAEAQRGTLADQVEAAEAAREEAEKIAATARQKTEEMQSRLHAAEVARAAAEARLKALEEEAERKRRSLLGRLLGW